MYFPFEVRFRLILDIFVAVRALDLIIIDANV